MQTVRVSIITPMFDAAATVGTMVESVARQDSADWELIVVDDCSTDASRDVVREVAARYPDARIRLIESDRNVGPSAARNRGLDLATGEFVMFVDADDELPAGAVSALLAAAAADVDLVVGVHALSTGVGSVSPRPDRFRGRVSGWDVANASLRGLLWNFLHGKLYRRTVFEEVRFPAGVRRYEDLVINTILYAQSRTVLYIDDVVYHYRVRPDSLTWSQPPTAANVEAPYAAIHDALAERTDVAPFPSASWAALRTFLAVMTLSGGITAGAGDDRLREIARAFRRSVPLRSLPPVIRANPTMGAAGALIHVSFPTYRRLYRRHVRRTFQLAHD